MKAIGIVLAIFALTLLGIVMFIYAIYSFVQNMIAKKNGVPDDYEEPETHITTCSHCEKDFSWTEKDILIKYSPGRGCKVPCPHCNKLLHIYDE